MYHTLYTFGYAQSAPDVLVRYLDDLGARLVDIRYVPRSRRAEWSGPILRRTVGPDRYIHLRALGNVNYNTGQPIALLNPSHGVAVLLDLLQETPIIIMCACASYETCHRRTVVRAVLSQATLSVIHLTAHGIVHPPASTSAT